MKRGPSLLSLLSIHVHYLVVVTVVAVAGFDVGRLFVGGIDMGQLVDLGNFQFQYGSMGDGHTSEEDVDEVVFPDEDVTCDHSHGCCGDLNCPRGHNGCGCGRDPDA